MAAIWRKIRFLPKNFPEFVDKILFLILSGSQTNDTFKQSVYSSLSQSVKYFSSYESGNFEKCETKKTALKDLHRENCWKKVSSWYLTGSNRYSAIPGAIV